MTTSPTPAPADHSIRPPSDTGASQVPCPVLWVTIAGYTTADVARQAVWRDNLTARANAALAGVPPDERIVLDAEAGLVVCFLSPPAVAARVAATLLASPGSDDDGLLKIGLAVGPVALVPARGDTLPRLLGDGVVVAERMNEFADAGQARASRAFVDAAQPDSAARARVFRPMGPCTDAQLRAHEVFAFDPREAGRLGETAAARTGKPPRFWRSPRVAASAVALSIATLVSAMVSTGSRPVAPPLPALSPPSVTSAAPETPAPVHSPLPPAREPLAPAAATVPDRAEARPSTPPPPAVAPIVTSHAPGKAGSRRSESPAAQKATVTLAISPWGEVHVNGNAVGVSPPLTEIGVPSGRVAIEVRNAGSAPYTETFTLQPGEKVHLRHKF